MKSKSTLIFRSDLEHLLSEEHGSRVIVTVVGGRFEARFASGDGDVEVPEEFIPARYNWSAVVRSALRTLKQAGLNVVAVDNGDGWEKVGSRAEAVELACACDTAYVRMSNEGGDKCTAFIVLGNEPEELFADYSTSDALDSAVDAFCSIWSGKRCPVVAE